MSSVKTMSWVGFAVVSLFSVGCGGLEASEAGSTLGTSTQALEQCNDEAAFELSGISRMMGRFPSAMACADFNGDGLVDLAVGAPDSGEVDVFLNMGDGKVSQQFTFNEDGWVDLAVTNDADGTVSFLMGQGPGGFAPPSVPVE
jgi:hypothetical protein